MKKILSLFLVAAALGYTSCDDETPSKGDAPTLTLSEASTQNIPGSEVSVTVTVDAPNGGETLQITGVDNPDVTLDGETEQDVVVDIEIPADAVVGAEISVVFTAVDEEGLASLPVEYTITVGDPIEALGPGNLATRTLDAGTQYMLKGQVFIPNGVTVTIPAGTVIKGEKASKATLVVSPGGKLVCDGTQASPVVFTSNQKVNERDRGDWGGIVILGTAYVNQTAQPAIEGISPAALYGSVGTDNTVNEDQNSGKLEYVRIEYGGIELTPNNETNSLTFGAVGRGTIVDNVQASFGGDDGFEWFGGTVDAKHLISFGMWDDDFDTDFGYRGRVQYGLVVRYGPYADQSGSNAFESDTQGSSGTIDGKCDATNFFGCTQAVFSNITVLGPRDFTTGLGAGTSTRTISASYQQAMHIRRASMLSIFNSVFAGFPTGFKLDEATTVNHLNNDRSKLAFNVLMSPTTTVLGTATSSVGVAFTTNQSSGDATFMQTYWNANNNTLVNPTGAAGWSPVAGTPANSINPYTGTGLVSTLFWAGGTSVTNVNGRGIAEYPTNPNFALEAGGTFLAGADFNDARLDAFFTDGAYKGAFGGTTDWTDTWTNFVPLTTTY